MHWLIDRLLPGKPVNPVNPTRHVFIHVPKSGGTSLRYRVRDVLKENVFYDYSLEAVETSPLVRQHLVRKDFKGLCDVLSRLERFVLLGHMRAEHYRDLLSVASFSTFLREPFDRILSAYNHYVRHYKYDKSFGEYIEDPRFRNQQSRMVGGVPLDAYGFVGLYENYVEDMGALFARMDLGPAVPRENVGDYGTIDKARLRAEFEARFRALNAEDYALYRAAKAMRADAALAPNR